MTTSFHHFSILIILLIVSAFFSGSESAIFSIDQIQRRRILKKHRFIGTIVEDLLARPRRTLSTILIGNMVVNTMAIVIVTKAAMPLFGRVGVGFTIAIFTLILIVCAEIFPKIFSVRNNQLVAVAAAVPLHIFAQLVFPLRYIIRRISDGTLSLLVREPAARRRERDLLSDDELKALVRIGEDEGALRKEEEKMIEELIDLGKRQVKQIMTPRPDLIAFDIRDGRDALVDIIRKSHFTYVPVFEDRLDHLLGVISTQEFMLDTKERLRELIYPPFYVPETKLIDELLQEFREKRQGFAICVDEYGGTAGLVTLEDILEEIFGEFYDEYAKTETPIQKIKPGVYVVRGKVSLYDLNETLGIHLESEDSETLGGWVLERFGRIPKAKESFTFKNMQFEILDVRRRRIEKLLIRCFRS